MSGQHCMRCGAFNLHPLCAECQKALAPRELVHEEAARRAVEVAKVARLHEEEDHQQDDAREGADQPEHAKDVGGHARPQQEPFSPSWSTEQPGMLFSGRCATAPEIQRAVFGARQCLGHALATSRGPTPTVIALRRDLEVLVSAAQQLLDQLTSKREGP